MVQGSERFPAIARAAQRFHERTKRLQTTNGDGVDESEDGWTHDGGDVTAAWMGRLGAELDRDVAVVRGDVEQIHEAVAREYDAVSRSVDALTAAFASGERIGEIETRGHSVATTESAAVGRSRVAVRRRRGARGSFVTMTVLPARGKPRGTALAASSRAARLAKEALSATTIQRAARRFLYARLYPRGHDQLRVAVAMRWRCEAQRWLRRWRSFVGRKRRMRQRLKRVERQSSGGDVVERCRQRAARVVETDGKFAQAKEFHRLRLLAAVLLGWLHAVTCDDDACCAAVDGV